MKKFWFDGQCSAHFGMMASGDGTYNAPERDVEMVSIPGRNGELILDNGRYKNIAVSYPVSICRDFPAKAAAARGWLMAKSGYKRLEDGYDPDHFRMAMFKGPINFDVSFLSRTGESELIFNCKPQRFLKAGEHAIPMAAPGSLWNPTGFPALPLITLYGTGAGTLTVGERTVEIKALEGHIVLDSDTQNAYYVSESGTYVNQNGVIYAPEFPVLEAGQTPISWTGDITNIEIIPRWWTLSVWGGVFRLSIYVFLPEARATGAAVGELPYVVYGACGSEFGAGDQIVEGNVENCRKPNQNVEPGDPAALFVHTHSTGTDIQLFCQI